MRRSHRVGDAEGDSPPRPPSSAAAAAAAAAASTALPPASPPPPAPSDVPFMVDDMWAAVRGSAAAVAARMRTRTWVALNLTAAVVALVVVAGACLGFIAPPPLPSIAALLAELPHIHLHAREAAVAAWHLVRTPPWRWTLPKLTLWIALLSHFGFGAAALGLIVSLFFSLFEWEVLARLLSRVAGELARTVLLAFAAFIVTFVNSPALAGGEPSLLLDALFSLAVATVLAAGWAPITMLVQLVAGASVAGRRAALVAGYLYALALLVPLTTALRTWASLGSAVAAIAFAHGALSALQFSWGQACSALAVIDVAVRWAAAPHVVAPFTLPLWWFGAVAAEFHYLGKIKHFAVGGGPLWDPVDGTKALTWTVLRAASALVVWNLPWAPHVTLVALCGTAASIGLLALHVGTEKKLAAIGFSVALAPAVAGAWYVRGHADAMARVLMDAWSILARVR